MKKVIFLWLLCISSIASALIVESSIPANGTANVPLATTLSATFSAPIDPAAVFSNGEPVNLEIHHPDSLTILSSSLSANYRTASMTVQLRPNNDYVAIIIGATTPTGDSLDIPYVVNFSTAPTLGNRQVSGIVTMNNVGAYRAIVGLARNRPFSEEGTYLVQATVVQSQQGSYSLPFTRPGTYYPIAAIDTDGDGSIDPYFGADHFGFYDPNNDGIADSIVVTNANLSNINFSLYPMFGRITARQRLNVANTLVQTLLPNPQLFLVYGFEVDTTGYAQGWGYYYRSPTVNYVAGVFVSTLFANADTTSDDPFPPNMLTLPTNWIDSDQAMSIAEQNGGSAFRAQYPEIYLEMYGGNFYWLDSAWQNHFIWVITYFTEELEQSIEFYIDMQNGQLLRTVNTKEPVRNQLPQSVILSQNYPNPFNAETNISFTLPRDNQVTLQILNNNGQLVTTLIRQKMTAGTHTVKWNATSFPSGVYYYRVQVGNQVLVRKMMLIK